MRTTEYEVGAGINLSSKLVKGGGHPIKLPFIDVSEIGAGGGSIVSIDPLGSVSVGPQSAGVRPGAGVLRDRGRRADAHGRAARARIPRRRATRRRRDHARSGAGTSGARPGGDAARTVGRGGSARHPAARRRDHDARGEGRHDVPGPRPPRLHALRIRGQRAADRRRGRARPGDEPRARPTRTRCLQRPRAALLGHGARGRANPDAARARDHPRAPRVRVRGARDGSEGAPHAERQRARHRVAVRGRSLRGAGVRALGAGSCG